MPKTPSNIKSLGGQSLPLESHSLSRGRRGPSHRVPPSPSIPSIPSPVLRGPALRLSEHAQSPSSRYQAVMEAGVGNLKIDYQRLAEAILEKLGPAEFGVALRLRSSAQLRSSGR
ncbi:MAG TPA: hypothetical protein VJX67_22590 [Blastocatellia bacterium]|nr:hypothetical protein [Blastocatellia bacterium]